MSSKAEDGKSPQDTHSWSGSQIVDSLTNNAQLLIFAYSPKLRSLLAWSPNLESVLGVRDLGIVRDANIFLRYVHPDDRFQLMNALEQALAGKESYRATYRWIRPDNNQSCWLHCRASIVERPDGPIFEGTILDLSAELTGSTSKLAGPDSISTILAAFPTMVFTLDKDLRLLRVNRSSSSDFFNFGDQDYDPQAFQIGRNFLDGFSNAEQRTHYADLLAELLENKKAQHRGRIFMQDTVYSLEILPMGADTQVQGLLFIVSDISEVVRSERQLAELRKTEGLRLLAAGVAHNFNNSLQSIVGYAAAINNHANNPQLVKESSQSILDIVNKTSQLAHQLLADNSSKASLLVPTDLNLTVMAAVNRIDNLFSSGLKIAVAFGNPPEVMARTEELVDAIEAILLNAREALSSSGTVSIKTFQVHLDNLEVEDLAPGSYAKLSISDSGSGMEASTISRAFDPFFSTKEQDPQSGLALRGRGLGLSRTFSIVRSLGGAIAIESQPGSGTTVSVYLPSQIKPAQTSSSIDQKEPERAEILIVDDDIMVLKTMRAVLNDLGHACFIAEDYRKALQIVKTHRQDLRLVLLDAVMPGMDGLALLRKIKRLRKDLKVVGFSGAPSDYTKPMLEAGAIKVLRKPVDPRTLQETIRECLETRQAA